ncbi:hypothetical protein V494_04476 [Pseudogymnoascus sp. VKM F-4513 (FW-928)]|nr:hypothetical protein V494_04476 [Pseudogymnoascus sp. VKM F-4513 (FW-928)]
MADPGDGDDFFSDDGLDGLAPDALDEIENNAIRYTQYQATQALTLPASSDYGDDLDDEDLDDAVVFDGAQINPTNRLTQFQSSVVIQQARQFQVQRHSRSETAQPLSDRSKRPSQNNPHFKNPLPTSRSASAGQSTQPDSGRGNQTYQNVASPGDGDFEALQKKIEALQQEKDQLMQDLLARTGEISIVRSKQERQLKEHERELTALRKLNAESTTKNQKAIEEAKEAEKTRATELEFAKRDLFEESEKVRSLIRQKEKIAQGIEVSTPKKDKTSAFRDGFDDDEIRSPSKFNDRKSNQSSPRKLGAKRKRKGQESPAPPLDVAHAETATTGHGQADSLAPGDAILERFGKPDDSLDFLKTVLDHKIDRNHLKTIEELTKFAFPSAPAESLTSLILGKLPTLSTSPPSTDFPIELCELIISLWSRCLSEKYYKPIFLLLDLLSFALELRTVAIAPFILDALLPTAQETAVLIALPRFRQESYSKYEADIDLHACLVTIHLAALGCICNKEYTTRFWRQMRLDFVLMTLSQHQPVEDFDMMLQLLAMSVLKDSIGPISAEPDSQPDQMKYILDRVGYLLGNNPVASEGKPKCDAKTLAKLRSQILTTLISFSYSAIGSAALAAHPHAIGRIVKALSGSMDALYSYPSFHASLSQIITKSIRLLYYLYKKHPEIDMQQKLSVVHGGSQKYLIALARLNYTAGEHGVLEYGIGEDTSQQAHELLENALTPEEGEAVHDAFVDA